MDKEIISLSEEIIEKINLEEIILFNAKKPLDVADSAMRKLEKERIKQLNEILIKALFKKARALQNIIEAFQVKAEFECSLKEYEENYALLSQLVRVSNNRSCLAVYIWREKYYKRFCSALKVVINGLKQSAFNESEYAPTKLDLVNMQITILQSLDWKLWEDQISKYKLYRFPKSYSTF